MENNNIKWYKKIWFIIAASVALTLIVSSIFFALVLGGKSKSDDPDVYVPPTTVGTTHPVDELDNIIKLKNGEKAIYKYKMNLVDFVNDIVVPDEFENISGGYAGWEIEFDLYATDESQNEYIINEYGWDKTYALNLTFYGQYDSWDVGAGISGLYQSFDLFTMEYNLFINPDTKEVVKTNTFYGEGVVSAYGTLNSYSDRTLTKYSSLKANKLFIQKEYYNGVGKEYAIFEYSHYNKLNPETGMIENIIDGDHTCLLEHNSDGNEFNSKASTDWSVYNEDLTIYDDYININ